MESKPIHFIGVRQEDEFAPCVDYILRTFARNSEFSHACVTPSEAPQLLNSVSSPRVVLIYEDATAALDVLGPLLNKSTLAVIIERSPFFCGDFLKTPDLPASSESLLIAAGQNGLDEFTTEIPNGFRLSLDVIAPGPHFRERPDSVRGFLRKAGTDHGGNSTGRA